jgi:hypothetical protein
MPTAILGTAHCRTSTCARNDNLRSKEHVNAWVAGFFHVDVCCGIGDFRSALNGLKRDRAGNFRIWGWVWVDEGRGVSLDDGF